MQSREMRVRATIPLVVAVTLSLPACGRDLAPEDIPDVAGAWTYSEVITSDDAHVSCDIVGTLTIEQSFETFVGSFTRSVICNRGGNNTESSSESGSITRGRVDDRQIEFRIGSCDYRGVLTGDEPDRLTGSTLCLRTDGFTVTSTPRTDAGSWQAQRLSRPGDTP